MMHIRVLGSFGSRLPGFHTSSLLLNQTLLVDAGTITAVLTQDEQMAIEDVLLTHAHLDHTLDLTFLVDNIMPFRSRPLRIWAPQPVLDDLHRHLFNDATWPDFTRLPSRQAPILELHPLPAAGACEIAGLTVRWTRTAHPVHAVGYCLQSPAAGFLFSGDTTVTEELWTLAGDCPQLKLAIVETSFPNRFAELARVSGHLTPAMLAGELAKLGRPQVPVGIFHMKPQFLDELRRELAALNDPRLQILYGGEEFQLC
jgi:cAMP phosphodiesterase